MGFLRLVSRCQGQGRGSDIRYSSVPSSIPMIPCRP